VTNETDSLLANLGSVSVGKDGEILTKGASLDDDVVELLVENVAEGDVSANGSACAERRGQLGLARVGSKELRTHDPRLLATESDGTADSDPSLRLGHLAEHSAEQRTLARADTTDNGEKLSLLKAEVDVDECSLGVGLGVPAELAVDDRDELVALDGLALRKLDADSAGLELLAAEEVG
jgi:hypothetical protein